LSLALIELARYAARVRPSGWRIVAPLPAIVLSTILVTQCLALLVVYGRGRAVGLSYDRDGQPVEYRRFYYDSSWRAFDEAVAWLATHAAPSDIVATSSPHLVYLGAGLQAVMPPFEPDPERADRLLASVPVKYIIVDDLDFLDVSRRYAEPVVQRYPDRWRVAYVISTSGLRIYERMD
jgi:hypothetical protein